MSGPGDSWARNTETALSLDTVSAVNANDVEIEELGPSGSGSAPGISTASTCGDAQQGQGPTLVVIEDPTGNIYLGMDVPRWEKEAEERRRNAPQITDGTQDIDNPNLDELMPFTDEHHLALVARRRSGCLFLLCMDIAYLVFVGMIPFISPEAYGSNNDIAENGTQSAYNNSAISYATPAPSDLEFNETGSTVPGESGSSGSSLSDIERVLIEVSVYIAVDILGIIACLRSSPALLTIFITLLSCVTVLTAVAALSPVLVFRMIIVMLALQLRSGILLLQPRSSEPSRSLRGLFLGLSSRIMRMFGQIQNRGDRNQQTPSGLETNSNSEALTRTAAAIHQPVTVEMVTSRTTPAATT